MKQIVVMRGKAIQILRDELAQEGIRPNVPNIETAMGTVKNGGYLLRTGAKLLYSAHSRRYLVSGYAWDGRDVLPYIDNHQVALRSADAERLLGLYDKKAHTHECARCGHNWTCTDDEAKCDLQCPKCGEDSVGV